MIKTGVLIVSDKGAAGERKDKSGPVIEELIARVEGKVNSYRIISDHQEQIRAELIKMADEQKLDLVVTSGGTGLAPRDMTPDATRQVIDREIPGIAETIRAESFKKTSRAMLSRGLAGVRGKTLIINLPGSPRAVEECLEIVLPVLNHAVELIQDQVDECGRE